MKFFNYLNEGRITDTQIKETLEKDCKPFLKEWDSKAMDFLYTGRKDDIKDIDQKSVRKDRLPKDTPEQIHVILDDWFYKKFGVKARSNAVFCTQKYGDAVEYGTPYLIFPIGKYTIISSNRIEDLYTNISDVFFDMFTYFFSTTKYERLKEEDKENFLKMIEEKILKKGNYKKGLQKHNNEQMITCNQYYLVNVKYENYLYNELEI